MRNPRVARGAAVLLLAALVLPACRGSARSARPAPRPAAQPDSIALELRRVLAIDPPTPAFYDAWARLEARGAALDPRLMELARDARARPEARANALVLLAERRVPGTLALLRTVLLTEPRARVRTGAVLALQKLTPDSAAAAAAIRSALGDRDRMVRVQALQGLELRDAPLIHALLRRERDAAVRALAEQILVFVESRGAPLGQDRAGNYVTTVVRGEPRLILRPTRRDSAAGLATGDLYLRPGGGRPEVLLAQGVEVVGGVVPAFFSADRRALVFEAAGRIFVRSGPGQLRPLGPGIAPRVLPLSDQFVFLRELPGAEPGAAGGAVRRYQVLRADFLGGAPEPLGELRATSRPGVHAGASPVRWMLVADVPEGFVLQGEQLTTFALPSPFPRTEPGAPPRR